MQTITKNKVLKDLAKLIRLNASKIILANQTDLDRCPKTDSALFDRLKLNMDKIEAMKSCINQVIQMPDPEGNILYSFQKHKDLLVENRVVPFGTILIIYESRPDVTIEAAITAFKAGNKIYLKGGKEARSTNLFLADLWQQALELNHQNKNIVQYLDYNRSQTQDLIKTNKLNLDLIIPRGGEQLIQSIRENTQIPMIISGRGNNFLYIDKDADFDMAIEVILDGKKRISVCNALDKVYIHKSHKHSQFMKLIHSLLQHKIEIVADSNLQNLDPAMASIDNEEVYYEEFLSNKILLATINSLDQAIMAINKYSGGHSAVIITNDKSSAQFFQNNIDCAAVYHNASSRFTDGGEFGLGAEIAISTQKLHFRGPVGLNELVTNKWFISGNGNVRG
jgi:glutamate-5-semialdehyde dehydrogenase